jgi:hypothetical protein
MGNAGSGFASRTPGVPDQFSGGYDPTTGGYASYTAPDTSFSAGVERLGGGSMGKGAMKLGLTSLPLIAAAAYEEPITYDQMKEAEAYDPYETLNLNDPALDSGIEDVINEDSGLRLYANEGGMVPTYAEGGTVEQGMEAAIARNQGTAYAQPTTAYTPTTAPSNNIKIAGADNSTSNLTGGVGSLNVGSGTIGQSANAVAETARLKAIEDAKPKIETSLFSTYPNSFIQKELPRMNNSFLPIDPGIQKDPVSGALVGQFGRGYAEGGAVEQGMEAAIARNKGVASITSDKGMSEALARNKGTAYTQPTTAYTPTTAPSNNIKIAGADNSTSNIGGGSTSNLTGGVGSLNVGSGSIGKAPNVKAAEDLRKTQFKMLRGYEVPLDYTPATAGGQGNIFSGYSQPTQASHTYNRASKKWEKSKPIQPTFQIGGSNGIGNQYSGYQAFSGYGGPAAGVAQYAEGGRVNLNSRGINLGGRTNVNDTGALNLNTGVTGQSANARAAEAAKPKMKMLRGYEVPIDYVPGNDAVMGMGTAQSHYYDRDAEEWKKGQRPSNPFTYGVGSGGIGNQFSWLTGGGENPYYAEGGAVKGYAEGGYLQGPGDGMSDDIPAIINGEQPAALADGEFVVPADVVSHLGNGSSEAGSKQLYAMMDRIRKARTGRESQGKEIKPKKYMPV